jgi:hypothetical protein
VAPVLEAGRFGGSKPSRGWETLEAERTGFGTPGIVDLRTHVAVGARNPMKGAGAAQDSGGVVAVSLGGGLEPMRVPDASASGSGSSENRVVVETARREPGTE